MARAQRRCRASYRRKAEVLLWKETRAVWNLGNARPQPPQDTVEWLLRLNTNPVIFTLAELDADPVLRGERSVDTTPKDTDME